jgi:hypothetical protein
VKLHVIRNLIALVLLSMIAVACQGVNINIALGPTATPTVTPTATPNLERTATAQAETTATAQAQATATAAQATSSAMQATNTAIAQATATAQTTATAIAQATGTVAAQATATQQVRATSTAQVQATITAQAQVTATLIARATATGQASKAQADALMQKAKQTYTKKEGVIEGVNGPYIASFVPNLNMYNFVAEATFFNPADRTVHPWDYGFVFRYTSGDTRYNCRLFIHSSGVWALLIPQQTNADSVTSKIVGSGALRNLDLSPTGSNHVRVIAYEKTGYLFVNNEFVSTFDLSDTFGMDLWMGSAFTNGTSFPGLRVKFTDFNVYSFP